MSELGWCLLLGFGVLITVQGKNDPVVGGVAADPDAWPWMAALGKLNKDGVPTFFCGGALFHKRYVLTAAHCVPEKPTFVRLGETNLNPAHKNIATDAEVEEIISHPWYSYPSLYHDIALIRLTADVSFTRQVRPICLPPADLKSLETQWASLTGWGYTSFVGDASDTLQEVEVQIIRHAECFKDYDGVPQVALNFPNGILKTHLCASVPGGGKDACQGDSGGPLQFQKLSRDPFMLVGVVSGGLGCGFENFPGVYTKVTEYLAWILANMEA